MNNIEAIADFLCNGMEHGSDEENRSYLKSEFGLTDRQIDRLMAVMKMPDSYTWTNSTLFPLIGKALEEK